MTLALPFTANSRHELYELIKNHYAPNPKTVNAALPDDLCIIIGKCLEKEPDRRYQSASDLADDLNRFLKFEPILAKPASTWTKTQRWLQRNKVVATAGILIFLALSVAAATFYIKEGDAREARDFAQSETKKKSIALKGEQEALRKRTAALAAETKALEAEQKERKAKEKALDNYDRLADVKVLEKAQAASNLLYPPSPDLVPKLLAWQENHGVIASRLEDHKRFLKSLRSQAIPYTESERQRDFAKEIAALKRNKETLIRLEADLAKAKGNDANKKLLADKKKIEEQSQKLNETIAGQRSWDFGDKAILLLQHDIISELVTKLEKFTNGEQGPMKSIEERLTTSREIAAKTLKEHNDAWVLCRDRIKKNKIYDGLTLKPQLGLIPMGPDPASGLEEFLHYLTHKGAVPERNGNREIPIAARMGVILVLIPGGTFLMGSQKKDPDEPNFDPNGQSGESPVHKVALGAYFMSKYEMTQGQWRNAFSANPSYWYASYKNNRMKKAINLRHPVDTVSWPDAQKLLSRIDLLLPTEAEWERAARAGRSVSIWAGTSKIGELREFANINGSETKDWGFTGQQPGHNDGYTYHAPVGSFSPNRFGLHDMTGNVLEWCLDAQFSYETEAGYRGIRGIKRSSQYPVNRGGSFLSLAARARVAYRNTNNPEAGGAALGIRPSRIITF